MIYVYIALILLGGYLLGSISSAIVLIWEWYHRDIRTEGSGNAGATNAARSHGLAAGLMTLGGDMLKAAVSGLIGYLLGPLAGIGALSGVAVASAACFTGHCWPIYYRFKGGKGVSVAACVILLLDWRAFLVLLGIFVVTFLLWRRVSVCSIVSAVFYPTLYYLFNPGWSLPFAVCLYIAVTCIFQHRANIGRILRGEEKKFTLGNSEK